MEELIIGYLGNLNTIVLLLIIAVFLYLLGKGADLVVEQSVAMSLSWGVPKVIVGSTIVSLGTTLPEASVSVMAAINGTSGLALGNAVGSIIADTALILGLSVLIGLIPIKSKDIKKQANFQLSAVVLLGLASFSLIYSRGGARITQWMGFIFVALLIAYIIYSIKNSRDLSEDALEENGEEPVKESLLKTFSMLIIGIFLIILSSKILIPAIQIVAVRIGIPEAVIGATLVAFGTSLPELVTAVTAVRKGYGDLAIGNVIGADILNVLFVVGASASVTPSGLEVPASFLTIQIPFMLAAVLLLRLAIKKSEENIRKVFGYLLLILYIIYIILTFAL